MASLSFKDDRRISDSNRALLKEFCGELGGNIVKLANDLGVKVYAEEMWPYQSGYVEYAPTCGSASNYRIVVNSRHSPERQRFTVAHELAHYLLHRDDKDYCFQSETRHRSDDYFEYEIQPEDKSKEREANGFAAAILMPPNLFVPSFERLGHDIRETAKLFFVSEDAVRRRARELGLSVPNRS